SRRQKAPATDRRRFYEMANSICRKHAPRIDLSRINFPPVSNVRMSENARCHNAPTLANATRWPAYRYDLTSRERRKICKWPAIDHLDADGIGVDVAHAFPRSLAGVPCAVGFAHHLGDAAILVNQVVT